MPLPTLTRSARTVVLAVIASALLAIIVLPQAASAVVAPTVTNVSPNYGPTSGGTSVTITGSGFLSATNITFGGTPVASAFVSNDNVIVATSPVHGQGTYDVIVWAGSTPSPSTVNDQFSYYAGPVVTGLYPSVGPISGGTLVQVTG